MIRAVKFVSIPVADQNRALAFYTGPLGLTLLTDQPMGPQRWIELGIPGAETRVVLFTTDGHADRVGTRFNGAFASDDVSATYEELRSRGVTFAGPPEVQPWGTFAIFHDSEGNEFVLSSAA